MNPKYRVFAVLGLVFLLSLGFYFWTGRGPSDVVLIGTVDANQVIVSAQVEGRIQKLMVDEGTPVKVGDLIAVLDPSELQAQDAAATATITTGAPKTGSETYQWPRCAKIGV